MIDRVYHTLTDNLKQDQYLSEQEIIVIKKDQNYKNNLNNTLKLIHMNTPNGSYHDKLHYKVADFLSSKLSNLSKYFDNKNTSYFQKIDDIKSIVTENIKIGVTLQSKETESKNIPINSLEGVKKMPKPNLSARRSL